MNWNVIMMTNTRATLSNKVMVIIYYTPISFSRELGNSYGGHNVMRHHKIKENNYTNAYTTPVFTEIYMGWIILMRKMIVYIELCSFL